MGNLSVNVDIDIYDILDSLHGKRDKIELLEMLLNRLDPKDVINTIKSHKVYDDTPFSQACEKININRWRLPLEQEQLILQIANKL